jgi:hypothetical protein
MSRIRHIAGMVGEEYPFALNGLIFLYSSPTWGCGQAGQLWIEKITTKNIPKKTAGGFLIK